MDERIILDALHAAPSPIPKTMGLLSFEHPGDVLGASLVKKSQQFLSELQVLNSC